MGPLLILVGSRLMEQHNLNVTCIFPRLLQDIVEILKKEKRVKLNYVEVNIAVCKKKINILKVIENYKKLETAPDIVINNTKKRVSF